MTADLLSFGRGFGSAGQKPKTLRDKLFELGVHAVPKNEYKAFKRQALRRAIWGGKTRAYFLYYACWVCAMLSLIAFVAAAYQILEVGKFGAGTVMLLWGCVLILALALILLAFAADCKHAVEWCRVTLSTEGIERYRCASLLRDNAGLSFYELSLMRQDSPVCVASFVYVQDQHSQACLGYEKYW